VHGKKTRQAGPAPDLHQTGTSCTFVNYDRKVQKVRLCLCLFVPVSVYVDSPIYRNVYRCSDIRK
jgi:hypothetical protein